jgi:hypothetical protein
MNTYNDKSPNAQFGNVRSVKELASVANQMGHSRTLAENYGAGGWDIRFEDLKRLGDWSYALGVNTNNEHLSFVTIKGARKRDHPQSFSYHAPWFEGYHVLADYFTRLSYILSQGRQINHIVVIEPTTTAWMYQGNAKLKEIGQSFTDFVNALEHAHIEYDLASEDIIKRFGKIDDKNFVINQAKYDLIIIPPNTENLNGATLDLLTKYRQNGGNLIYVDTLTTLRDGSPFSLSSNFAKKVTVDEAVAAAKERTNKDGIVINTESDVKHIFHHRRRLADCEILFLCNASSQKSADVKIRTDKKRIAFDLQTGEIETGLHQFSQVTIPPSGSVLYALFDEQLTQSERAYYNEKSIIEASTAMKIRRLEDNVLTLDYVDVKVGGEEQKDIYTWAANRFVFQKHGMVNGNPWDSQVQFKDELITKKFATNSGFEATYHFTLQESIPNNFTVVIERPDLYVIYCNDKEVSAIPNAWWLDRSFGKIDLTKVAKVGKNEIKIVAQPMTIEHEIEPVYLLGDFSLQNSSKGFVVIPSRVLSMQPSEVGAMLQHDDAFERVSWLSAGVGFHADKLQSNDRAPELEFDFGVEQEIVAIRIWNYNERNLKRRGVKTVEISGLGKIDLPIGDGLAYEVPFNLTQKFKTITFKILSNHNNVTYPIKENDQINDNGFVGLAEVQFFTKKNDVLTLIKNVRVKASSELVVNSHDRKALYLIDGSGFDSFRPTWNRQGMPFYAGKIEYSCRFNVSGYDLAKRYFVELPLSPAGWYGSTSQVVVNGQSAGFVISAPYRINVTKMLRAGENEISVIVYGTPKNLLGPHHAGPMRGQAWPNAFHRAPKQQPSGASYDTIGYGLFEPFILYQNSTQQK